MPTSLSFSPTGRNPTSASFIFLAAAWIVSFGSMICTSELMISAIFILTSIPPHLLQTSASAPGSGKIRANCSGCDRSGSLARVIRLPLGLGRAPVHACFSPHHVVADQLAPQRRAVPMSTLDRLVDFGLAVAAVLPRPVHH